jgi:hypothetical protein
MTLLGSLQTADQLLPGEKRRSVEQVAVGPRSHHEVARPATLPTMAAHRLRRSARFRGESPEGRVYRHTPVRMFVAQAAAGTLSQQHAQQHAECAHRGDNH